jgi:hypothetical protein
MRCAPILALILASPTLAVDPHTDVLLTLPPGGAQFTTGAFDFNGGQTIASAARVFRGRFGEAGQPDFTDDPGFTAPSGTLPAQMLVGFDIADAVRVWDGADFDALSPSTITCERFASVATSPGGIGQTTPGFWIDTTGAAGGLHVHMDYYLDAPASDGIYLLTLQVRTNHPTIAHPEPIFVVFDMNNAGGSAAVDAAVAYVESLLAPPTSCAGDVNGDGATNASDFTILAGAFGTSVTVGTNGDLNGDGLVNAADFVILAGDFGCVP